jgi:imidazolonepropionase-like amidohydrolase
VTWFILLALTAWGASGQKSDIKVIRGATLIDGTGRGPVKGAVVAIEGPRIRQVGAGGQVKIPEGADVITAEGKFIIPGLADMHNHLGGGDFSSAPPDVKKNLAQLLAWGVTTIFATHIDMKNFAELKSVSKEAAAYPRFFAVGRLLTAKNGWASFFGGYTPETTDAARAAVRELKAAHVDAIKLIYDDMSWLTKSAMPMLKPDVMGAIIDEAHRQGLKAYAHAPILKHAKETLRKGIDGFVHGIISDPVDDEFIDLMKKNHAFYTATLTLFEACADLAAWSARVAAFDERGAIKPDVYDKLKSPDIIKQWESGWTNIPYTKERMPVLRANLKKLSDAGVPVVTGTDTGVPGVLLGVSSQMELVLHVEAGLRPADVIRAATLDAQRMLGRGQESGSVEAGKQADFLILDADPLADIRNVRKIHRVVKGGVVYDPTQLRRP